MQSLSQWWESRVQRGVQINAQRAEIARQQVVSGVRSLRDLPDDELIAAAPAHTSLSRPHHEMEMQRRLKDAVIALTEESKTARAWAAWGSAVIAVLTVVLIVLTVVLIKQG